MFYVGQKVVCVISCSEQWCEVLNKEAIANAPIGGQIYTIRDMRPFTMRLGNPSKELGLLLNEIRNEPQPTIDGMLEMAFHEIGFLPLDERKMTTEHELETSLT